MGLRIHTLSSEEMLSLWKLATMHEPARLDCVIERTDGIDLDLLLRHRIEGWYARQLLDLPIEELPLTEIAHRLTPVRRADGSAEVSLPEGTMRVAGVMMEGWHRAATVTANPESALAQEQRNPYSRGGAAEPVAIVYRDGRMSLHTPPPGEMRLTSVTAVVRPEDGSFQLTDAMLSRLDDSIII